MTLEELKQQISKSTYRKELQELEFTINYFDGEETIVGLYEIYRRISDEYEGWQSIDDSQIYEELGSSKEFFSKQFTNLNLITNEIERILDNWGSFTETTINTYSTRNFETNKNIFSYKSPSTQFLLKLYTDEAANGNKKNYPITDAAYKVFIKEDKSIMGQVMAYEFMMKDSSLTNRIESEKESLDNLRSEFTTAIKGAESQVADHLAESDSFVKEFSEKLDSLVNEKKELFEGWDTQNKTDYTNWKDKSEAEIESLRQLYTEKLRLSAPAEHWDNRAKKMNKRGNWACASLVGLILLTVLFLVCYFLVSPTKILSKVISGEADAIKWMLTTVTIISFLTYGIRSLNKLMFSSYHLARDAEERTQLTYVYLALIKEGGADKEDRSIVLQSIFSRADTGLLKEDSSPTMPNMVIEKLTSK